MREDKRKEKKRKVITSISRSKTELNYNERFKMSNKTIKFTRLDISKFEK